MKLISIPPSTFLFLLLFIQLSLQQDDSQCLSLAGSTTCFAFQKYYVSLYHIKTRYPTLSNITNLETFDSELLKYVTSTDLYFSSLGCDNKADVSQIPHARYSLTFMCANIIQNTEYSLPCNYKHDLSPPPLCKQTCFNWVDNVESITQEIAVCPNRQTRQTGLEELTSICQDWSGLNGTENCMLGLANEPSTCGFEDKEAACKFCRENKFDPCCEILDGCSNLSAGAIAGVIVGCLIFIACIGGAFFFLRKRHKAKQSGKVPFRSLNNHQNNPEFRDSVSALGYESLASQRALVQQKPPVITTTFDNHSYHNVNSQKPANPNTEPRVHHLPPPVKTFNLNSTPPLPEGEPEIEDLYEVKYPYSSQLEDELGLTVGDILCVAMNFDDGWALGYNVTTGRKGVFPLVCVSLASEELLEELLIATEQNSSSKILVEDGDETQRLDTGHMQQLCETIRRSMSISSRRTQPVSVPESTDYVNSIPRRTASMMRNNNNNSSSANYGYHEIDSPTSPSLSTPFFDVSMLNNPSSINDSSNPTQPEQAAIPPPEAFEMYRKTHNRVSKLEEPE